MNQITFFKTKGDKREEVKFQEGQKFELNGVEFRIVTIKDRGKMVIKPT